VLGLLPFVSCLLHFGCKVALARWFLLVLVRCLINACIGFSFHKEEGVGYVDVIMFNCLGWRCSMGDDVAVPDRHEDG